MASTKYDVSDALLCDEEPNASFVPKSRASSYLHRYHAIISHALVFLTTLLVSGIIMHFNAKHVQRHCKSDLVPTNRTQTPFFLFYRGIQKHAEARAPFRPHRESNPVHDAVHIYELLGQRASLGRAEPRDGDCVEQRVGR